MQCFSSPTLLEKKNYLGCGSFIHKYMNVHSVPAPVLKPVDLELSKTARHRG